MGNVSISTKKIAPAAHSRSLLFIYLLYYIYNGGISVRASGTFCSTFRYVLLELSVRFARASSTFCSSFRYVLLYLSVRFARVRHRRCDKCDKFDVTVQATGAREREPLESLTMEKWHCSRNSGNSRPHRLLSALLFWLIHTPSTA